MKTNIYNTEDSGERNFHPQPTGYRIRPRVKLGILRSLKGWVRRKREEFRRRKQFSRGLRESDAFLVGHPKSGNTWTAYMLGIAVNRDFENEINLSNIGEYVPTIHNRDFAVGKYDYLGPPRIFRNEGPLFPAMYPKTIYIVRDPRSVLLSYYHHCVHDTGDSQWSLDSFVDEMLAYGCIKKLEPYLKRWDLQVQEWLDRAGKQPVLIVRYEDLKQDQQSTLAKMLEFLGVSHDPELLDLAVQRTAFSGMRKEEEVYGAESFPGEKGSKGYFVRKGKIDSWKEEMPAATVEKIDRAFGSTMKLLNYR